MQSWMQPRLVAALLLVSIGAPAIAQSSDPGWNVDLAIYGMGAGLTGEAGAGSVTADIDVGFSDLLENLELGFYGAMQARKGRLVVFSDLLFGALGTTRESANGNSKADVDFDMLMIDADLGYALSDHVVVLGGVRLVDLDSEIDVRTPLQRRTAKGGENWVDPLVGARFTAPVRENWALTLRGDIGGFGVGSDLAWNAVATLAYVLSARTRFAFGYKVLDIDYDNGSGADRFLYDLRMSGPLAGVVLSF